MTAPIKRPDEWNTLGDHDRRIRILEASPGGDGSGSTVVCTGCYEIDPDFADCVNLAPGDCLEIAQDTFPDAAPSEREVAGSLFEVGPYRCNYAAGFRLQGRFYGQFGNQAGTQFKLLIGVGRESGTPGTDLAWQEVPGLTIAHATGPIDTGWVDFLGDPLSYGTVDDDWQFYLGGQNASVLFDGYIGAGTWCFRYVRDLDVSVVPTALAEGQILIAVGTPPVWTLLDPGTAGQVLTMSGGLPTWV